MSYYHFSHFLVAQLVTTGKLNFLLLSFNFRDTLYFELCFNEDDNDDDDEDEDIDDDVDFLLLLLYNFRENSFLK